MNIFELQHKLAESKIDNDCKYIFNELASFIDWFAKNKDQNDHLMNVLLQLVNKMEELSNTETEGKDCPIPESRPLNTFNKPLGV